MMALSRELVTLSLIEPLILHALAVYGQNFLAVPLWFPKEPSPDALVQWQVRATEEVIGHAAPILGN